MMVSQRSTKIPGGQTVVQAAVCTMAYVTILPGGGWKGGGGGGDRKRLEAGRDTDSQQSSLRFTETRSCLCLRRPFSSLASGSTTRWMPARQPSFCVLFVTLPPRYSVRAKMGLRRDLANLRHRLYGMLPATVWGSGR